MWRCAGRDPRFDAALVLHCTTILPHSGRIQAIGTCEFASNRAHPLCLPKVVGPPSRCPLTPLVTIVSTMRPWDEAETAAPRYPRAARRTGPRRRASIPSPRSAASAYSLPGGVELDLSRHLLHAERRTRQPHIAVQRLAVVQMRFGVQDTEDLVTHHPVLPVGVG